MIVCHCNVVNDRAISAAVDAGARTVSQVCHATGAGRDCGACVFAVKQVVCQHGAVVRTGPWEVESAAG